MSRDLPSYVTLMVTALPANLFKLKAAVLRFSIKSCSETFRKSQRVKSVKDSLL